MFSFVFWFHFLAVCSAWLTVENEPEIRFSAAANATARNFGIVLDLDDDGTTLVVGSVGSSASPAVVSVFQQRSDVEEWGDPQELPRPSLIPRNNWASSVCISGDNSVIAVGEYVGESMYIYERSGADWSSASFTKLNQTTESGESAFGCACVFSSDASKLFIGVRESVDGTGVKSGAVFIYSRPIDASGEFELLQILREPGFGAYASKGFFGRTLDVTPDGHRLVVGANQFSVEMDTAAGRAFVYDFDEAGKRFHSVANLSASNFREHAYYGRSTRISADGRFIALGSSYARGPNDEIGAGRAYVEDLEANVQTQILPAMEDVQAYSGFGGKVALSSDSRLCVVAAKNQRDANDHRSGALFAFLRQAGGENAWSEPFRLSPPFSERDGYYGYSLALATTPNNKYHVAVGAYGKDNEAGSDSGAVFTFLVSVDESQAAFSSQGVRNSNGNGGSNVNGANGGTDTGASPLTPAISTTSVISDLTSTPWGYAIIAGAALFVLICSILLCCLIFRCGRRRGRASSDRLIHLQGSAPQSTSKAGSKRHSVRRSRRASYSKLNQQYDDVSKATSSHYTAGSGYTAGPILEEEQEESSNHAYGKAPQFDTNASSHSYGPAPTSSQYS